MSSFKYDAFLSYAHLDDERPSENVEGWITAFQKALNLQCQHKLKRSVRIWRDDSIALNDMTNQDKVKKIIAEKLSVDLSEVVPEASFVDDLGADSLDLVELIMAFEEEFGGEISDDEAQKITTVGEAVVYLEGHL